MSFHYVISPVIDMRAFPSPLSQVVSQGLFSELVDLHEESGDWIKISTSVDHYSGWVLKHSIVSRHNVFPDQAQIGMVQVNRLAAHFYNEPETIYGPRLTLPFESKLELLEPCRSSDSRWLKVGLPNGHQGFIQRGDVSLQPLRFNLRELCELSLRFLDLPYTWGGRSSFGYDCSGFVQMLYRMMGQHIPRDAKDQILWKAFQEVKIEQMKAGDLIFFGLSKAEIRHVGFYLNGGRFIHAVATAENKPYIRISHLTDSAWNGSGIYPYLSARSFSCPCP